MWHAVCVLGLLAAVAAGAPSWEALVQARIFDPLNMTSTYTNVTQAVETVRVSLLGDLVLPYPYCELHLLMCAWVVCRATTPFPSSLTRMGRSCHFQLT